MKFSSTMLEVARYLMHGGEMSSHLTYLTPKDVAKLLMVSTAAIRLWAEKGELKAMMTAGGHRRFKLEDIKTFAKDKNIQLNIESDASVKILIIDDEILFTEFLEDALTTIYPQVKIAVSLDGFDAGIKLKDFKPSIVLLDLKMPGMDGFQVCQHIKSDPLLQRIRVIAMSGDTNLERKQKIIATGAEVCLSKPFKVAELIETLGL